MIRAVKGTRDLLPPQTAVWNHVERVAREVFRAYNYHEIRTPILEETQLFARGVGEETDIVTKEMYTFAGSRRFLAHPAPGEHRLRHARLHRAPPGSASRHAEALLHRPHVPPRASAKRPLPPVLSDRRGSHRLRIAPRVDAEVIEMVVEIFDALGITGSKLLINSVGDHKCRPGFIEKLRDALEASRATPCAPIASAAPITNPLRVLDCKVPEDQPIIDALPSILDSLCAKSADRTSPPSRQSLDDRGIPFEVRPRLVRGLDYYMRTTFEVVHGNLGAQNSVLGGGRYEASLKRWAPKFPLRASAFPSGKTAW